MSNKYEEATYRILFSRYYTALVNFASLYLRDPVVAEDIVQEVFVELWKKQLNSEDEFSLRVYLYRSVQHRCLNYIRNLKIKSHHEKQISDFLYPDETSVLNDLIKEDVYRQLFEAIEELPPQCRKICQMTLEGKKPSEIAKELNLAVETIKKQKKIALKRIQKKWGDLSVVTLLFAAWMDF